MASMMPIPFLPFLNLTLDDCGRSGLLGPAKCFDHLVSRFPGADASQNRDNWMSPLRVDPVELGIRTESKAFEFRLPVRPSEPYAVVHRPVFPPLISDIRLP